ncbi:hypothetical protein AB0L34_09140 [Micromonospora sp. NPDC052213]|uniref:hypothetical protein n=1 Tax=Micromonospora sp. NPDC052213 TaxID=3155812 RepID=UPI0034211F02
MRGISDAWRPMPVHSEDGLLKTGADLWRTLVEQGQIKESSFDLALREDVRVTLGLPSHGSFLQQLVRRGVSAQALLEALLSAIQPFSAMLVELLACYDKVRARLADQRSLRIVYDFNAATSTVVPLEHFRDQVRQWSLTTARVAIRTWSADALGSLLSDLQKYAGPDDDRLGDVLIGWLQAATGGRLPVGPPPLPSVGEPAADRALERVCGLAMELANQALLSPDDEREQSFGFQGRWIGDLVTTAAAAASRLRADLDRGAPGRARTLADAIRVHFDRRPVDSRDRQIRQSHLIDIFNLPVWGQRHAIYSAWTFSRIVSAIGWERTDIHVVDQALAFSRLGTHLATMHVSGERLHLYAEWRTPLTNPVGRGRTRAIQPDFVLLHEPVTHASSGLLVVECKQYRKGKASNFAHACADYATGHPQASVLLASYGRIPSSTIGLIPAGLQPRVRLLGDTRPGSALTHFTDAVREALPPPPSKTLIPGTVIALRWNDFPCDLDLHLLLRDAAGAVIDIINFSNPGQVDEPPWVEHCQDIQHGHGPEQIVVGARPPHSAEIWVHRYPTDPTPLARSDAEVEIVNGNGIRELVLRLPRRPTLATWWRVATLSRHAAPVVHDELLTHGPDTPS